MELKKIRVISKETLAVQITSENLESVALWCGGYISWINASQYGKMKHARLVIPHEYGYEFCAIGDFVLKQTNSFRRLLEEEFYADYDVIGEEP